MVKKGPKQDKKKTPRRIKKPKMTIKHGDAARQAKQEDAKRPATFWTVMIRLLPVWALLVMILILEPTLPLRAVGAAVQWVGDIAGPPEEESQPVEPVFIVEGANAQLPNEDLPPPSWDLEVSQVFQAEVRYWADSIKEWSVVYRIKPNLIATIMQIESCGDPTAVSAADAKGLFQVTDVHFEQGENPFDPNTNAQRGLTYFAEMYAAANGDLGLTFAAYNAGAWVIGASSAEWPQETQSYQFWATGIYEEAELGLIESPTLLDWLAVGGNTLCEQASEALSALED